MSWSAFEELKTFVASKLESKSKRKKEWNTPSTKKQKSSKLPNDVEGGIDGFSSEEENEKNDQKQLGLDVSIENKDVTGEELANLIEEIEDTPDDQNCIKTESLDIEVQTPTPTSTPICKEEGAEGTPKTGSEWLKQVQHLQSTPGLDTPPSPDLKSGLDSGKKKHKFKRSGLAEQLQRLINREKSDKSFWAHNKSAEKAEETAVSQELTATMDIQVLSVHMQYSLYHTRCCIIFNPPETTKPMVVDVVFNTDTLKQLTLTVGCAVRIHPPWQKLSVPSSPYPIILCTYCCERLSTSPESPLVDLSSLPDSNEQIRKPCQQLLSSLVASPKKGFQPSKLLFGATEESSKKEEEPSIIGLKDQLTMLCNGGGQSNKFNKILSIAEAIEAQGGCSGGCVTFQAVIQRVYRRRVRIAREKAFDSPSHSFLSKTLITRARSAEDKEEARWILLVQDSSHDICEIHIPQEHTTHDEWSSVIKKGEGKNFIFDDLRIVQRTNRTRSPGLFNIVDSLWNSELTVHCHGDKSSQIQVPSSEESSGPFLAQSSPPSYCYVLTVQASSHVTTPRVHEEPGKEITYKPSLLTNIRELSLYDKETPKRCAVWCRVICSRPDPAKRTTSGSGLPSWTGQFLVTDASLHRAQHCALQESQDGESAESSLRYLKLDVRPSHVLSQSVRSAVREAGCVLFIQDIACTDRGEHGIYADSYTSMKKGSTDPCQADIDKGDVQIMPLNIYSDLVALRTREFICPLSASTNKDSLCKVEGVVHGVDEESACCWLECATCACQDLLERTGLPYYCPICKQDVPDPQTKTNLDVVIKCDTWKEMRVKVKLLQATIEQILPVSYQDSDQGYDIECVLGKRLGPLFCYVEQRTESSVKLEEIAVSL